jgi:hypothetical protein
MKRKVSVLATLVAALCIARVAVAQDAPATGSAPAPSEQPAQPPPPPPKGYPPPPPRAPSQGGYQYPQQYPPAQYPQQYPPTYYAPGPQQRGWGYYAQPTAIYRPFSFTLGVGPGYLHGWGTNDAGKSDAESGFALSYNLFRLGFGIVPNLSFWLGFEGTGTNTTSPLTGENSWLRQENWLLGLQYHLVPRLYVRGGMGAGFISETTASIHASGGTGIAFAAAIGYEFVQTPHVALALDANGSVTKYTNQYWSTAGLNLAVSFF